MADEFESGRELFSPPREEEDPALVVDVDGFEGPLDLLLALARNQKVDLARISILALVEQYLAFVDAARLLRLELAADYLVMAAWLAYLKSRLLLPVMPDDDDEPSGEELAELLSWRLRRLEAMRDVAARLVNRPRMGRDFFARGAPEPLAVEKTAIYIASLYDLLVAYAAQRQRTMVTRVHVKRRAVWSLVDARDILERFVGRAAGWMPLEKFLAPYMTSADSARTVTASAFSASLELVREGHMELAQSGPFQPILLRKPQHRTEP